MHLLDTDTLTYLFEGHANVVQRLRELTDPDVGTTIVSRIEMLSGRFAFLFKAANARELLRGQELLERTEQRLAEVQVVGVNAETALRFDILRKRKDLKKIGYKDILIASIALANRATLVTRNLRHFRLIPGLRLENWVD